MDSQHDTASFRSEMIAIVVSTAMLALVPFECAFAYVDPSVMTYAIQAIAGVAVALSAVVGVALRRTRRLLFRLFNIDEDARRDRDPRWCALSPHGDNVRKSMSDLGFITDSDRSHRDEKHTNGKNLPRGKRLVLSFAVFACLVLTYGLVAPLETVAAGRTDLAITLANVLPPLLAFAAVFALVATIILSMLRGKAFVTGFSIVFWIAFCGYIQAMFMNSGLPAADGRPIDWWGAFGAWCVVSSIIWLGLLVAIIVFCNRKTLIATRTFLAISIVLVFVQSVAAIDLVAHESSQHSGELYNGPVYVTDDGLYDVSDKANVIVLVLDMYDTQDLQAALEVSPHLLDDFDGFTWYRDSVGMMLPTKYAIPYMLTRQLPSEGESIPDYLVRRYEDGAFLQALSATGYSVGVYSDNLQLGWLDDGQKERDVYDYCSNMHGLDALEVDTMGTIRMMVKCSLYRNAPWPLKGRFRFYTDDINKRCLKPRAETDEGTRAYVTDDNAYYERLKSDGLTVNPNLSSGAFRFIHLKGAHWPYEMDENARRVSESETDRARNACGAMVIASEYLKQLRNIGQYDKATIIITADHGNWYGMSKMPDYVTSPIMLVKPAGSSKEPLVVSDTPVSHDNFHATILNALGSSETTNFGVPIRSLGADGEEASKRYSYQITVQNNYVVDILLYEIDGDVLEFDSWHYTGQRWDAQELK